MSGQVLASHPRATSADLTTIALGRLPAAGKVSPSGQVESNCICILQPEPPTSKSRPARLSGRVHRHTSTRPCEAEMPILRPTAERVPTDNGANAFPLPPHDRIGSLGSYKIPASSHVDRMRQAHCYLVVRNGTE